MPILMPFAHDCFKELYENYLATLALINQALDLDINDDK